MSRIPDATIDEVRNAVDLVDVVSDYVRLKKQGVRFVGLCPFHNEKTPSFSVDARQDLFYCFGCKKGGDLFKFIEEIEGVGFLDAVRLLAERAGIEIPEGEGEREEASEREAMLGALRFAARFYFDQLKGERGKRGLAYLKERGFSKETIKTFGIGYAPDAWDALLKAATAKGFKPEALEAVGLVKRRQGGAGKDGFYDVFRDRLMFPILSPVGKVLGFGGRILPDSPTASADYTPAKYINTPETAVYHKSEVLFGLKQAKTAIRAEEEAILVEGYADVVSLYQSDIKNVVASSGTALTAGQVRLLGRYARTALLLYDADAAGVNAALKGVEAVLRAGLAVAVVALPDGADPDSFVRQFGAEAFRTILREERQDFVGFIARQARRSGLFDTPEGKAEAARQLLDAVALVQDPIAQDEYLLRAAAELGVPDATLRPQLRKRIKERSEGRAPSGPPPAAPPDAAPVHAEPIGRAAPPPPPVIMRPEEAALLRLMLAHGTPMVEHVLTRMALDEFSDGLVREVVEKLIAQYEADAVDAEPFLRGDYGEAVQRLAAEVLSDKHALSENWERRVGIAVPGFDAQPFDAAVSAMRLLKLDRVEEAIEAVKRRVFVADQRGEDLTALQQQHNELNALKRQIERGAFLEWGETQS